MSKGVSEVVTVSDNQSFSCVEHRYCDNGNEYEPAQQHVSRALKALGLTDAKGVATPGNDGAGGPKASEISELRRTAKWRDPPEEIEEDDYFLTGEELKLFFCVAARFNYLAMDGPDLLCSVTAFKRVARYTIKHPSMTCRYPWTQCDNNIEVFGDANVAGCISTRKSTAGGVEMWSGQFVKA